MDDELDERKFEKILQDFKVYVKYYQRLLKYSSRFDDHFRNLIILSFQDYKKTSEDLAHSNAFSNRHAWSNAMPVHVRSSQSR